MIKKCKNAQEVYFVNGLYNEIPKEWGCEFDFPGKYFPKNTFLFYFIDTS